MARRSATAVTKIGVVIPTMGLRANFFKQSLASAVAAGATQILIVSPQDPLIDLALPKSDIVRYIRDPKAGLASAINFGIASLDEDTDYVTWIGDDDLLAADSLTTASKIMNENPEIVATFGICEYIDEEGALFWVNSFGQLAVPMLNWGPNKIPQPGSLVKASAFNLIGGLDTSLGWAFDQDMFSRLARIGRLKFINRVMAQYRWHNESLSSSLSERAILESSHVRLKNAKRSLRLISLALESVHVPLALRFSHRLDKISSNRKHL